MTDKSRRRSIRNAYAAAPPDAGVYAVRNMATGRRWLASTPNLAGARGRFEFAKTTNSPGALDHRIIREARTHGIDNLKFEILEILSTPPTATDAEIRADLATLLAMTEENLADRP